MTAWSLTRGITDIYVGEVQDVSEEGIVDAIDFAQRIGATLHLFFAYGETYRHARVLERLGSITTRFQEAPDWLTHPQPPDAPEAGAVSMSEAPEDDWPTFRSAYKELFTPAEIERCDEIYRDTVKAAQCAGAMAPIALAGLIGELWARHGCEGHERVVVARAVQAGAFLAGHNIRVNFNLMDRYVRENHFNPLSREHYRELATFADPWRSAAAVLHAHRVPVEVMRTTKARDVGPDGDFPGVAIQDPEAKAIVAAQKWAQHVGSQDADPPFLSQKELDVRAGIKSVATELSLPLITTWRRSGVAKFQPRTGIVVEKFAS